MSFQLIANDKPTYKDSLEVAFDYCVFKHDSLASELAHVYEVSKFDSAIISERYVYTNILEGQIDELNAQIKEFKRLLNEYIEREKKALKQAKKDKFKSNLAYGLGGVSLGAGLALLALFALR